MFKLDGKSALVTGASGGIGGAIARQLHARGATVGLSGTREDALAELAASLGERAHVLPCDLGDGAAVADLPKTAEAALGQIDILVNNAGLTRDNLFMRMKDEEWDTVLAVNLTSAFKLSRAVLRGMMKRRFGRIIGISSVVGVTGNPGQGNYAASKAGMIGFTKSIALELGSRNIRCNAVAPGFIETEMTAKLDEKTVQSWRDAIPLKRGGTPVDVANACLFLASDLSAYTTGQVLHVDGGMLT